MRISDWSSDVCSSDLCWHILRHLARIDEDRGNWPLFQNSGDIRVHLRMIEKRQRKCTPTRQTAQTRQRPGNIAQDKPGAGGHLRSEEHTSELKSLMRIPYADFCVK